MQKIPLLIVGIILFVACQNEAANSRSDFQGRIKSIEIFMPEEARVIFKRSCQSCHGIDGRGIAAIAPDIARAAPRSIEAWERYLRNPQRAHPVAQKPPLWLDVDEVKIIAEFLDKLSRNNSH